MTHPAIRKYLTNYAEPEAAFLDGLIKKTKQPFNHVLVIPAYKESSEFIQRLLNTDWQGAAILAIIVINAPETENSNEQLLKGNSPEKKLWADIQNTGAVEWQHKNITLVKPSNNRDHIGSSQLQFLVVDRFSEGQQIPIKQGVGLARKIGVDLAIAIQEMGLIEDPWIFSTDADAHLHHTYFSLGNERKSKQKTSAFVLPFKHTCDNSLVGKATKLYEQTLHYYVDALRNAGSPYAFHTVGSSLCVHADYYCQARGFPKRSGGEDFYLLNKLAKLAPVKSLSEKVFDGQPALTLDARLSDRVPFGTGPGVSKIIQLQTTQQPVTNYNPEIFVALKQVLQLFNRIVTTHHPEKTLLALPAYSRNALEDIGIHKLFEHLNKLIQEGKTTAALVSHFHNWFDAFKTLKFVHHLQQNTYPAVSIENLKKNNLI